MSDNQTVLELDEEIFDKLFAFLNNDDLSNPYKIVSKNGKWVELYIEDSYDYIEESNYKKYVLGESE